MLEPYPHLVDGLAACMHAEEHVAQRIDGSVMVADVLAALDLHYDWADRIDLREGRAGAGLVRVRGEAGAEAWRTLRGTAGAL